MFRLDASKGVSSRTGGWSSLTTKSKINAQMIHPVQPNDREVFKSGNSPDKPIARMSKKVIRAIALWVGPNME